VVREPLLVPFLALAAGILAGHFNYFEIHDLIWPLAASALLLTTSLSLCLSQHIRVLCLILLFGFVGVATQILHRQNFHPRLNVADGDFALLEAA
jgi:hypothetical protein